MPVTRRGLLATAMTTTALPLAPRATRAQASQTIRIGVLNDQSGPFRDIGGSGSVAATRQAVKEFGDHGFAVDVIVADHQNKPDVGARSPASGAIRAAWTCCSTCRTPRLRWR